MENKTRHFIVCPPTYFSIDYKINEWMNLKDYVDGDVANNQWETLISAYRNLNLDITIIPPKKGFPELNFPGDSVFLFENHAFISNFKYPVRDKEAIYMQNRYEKLGYLIHEFPEDVLFEGNAMVMYWNGLLLGGTGERTNRKALEIISNELEIEVIELHLQNPYFHLDISICPLGQDTLAFYPKAFDDESVAKLESLASNIIEVDSFEAKKLACNSMYINDYVILSTPECPNFIKSLKDLGYQVVALNLSEFRKAGGGAKCLTLEAYSREQ